jgi:hypothetical protein
VRMYMLQSWPMLVPRPLTPAVAVVVDAGPEVVEGVPLADGVAAGTLDGSREPQWFWVRQAF